MLCELRRVASKGGRRLDDFGGTRGVGGSKPRAVSVVIISLCCTCRMLDLLLSIDMAHFSGRGGGRHRGFGSTWECVWKREILFTVCEKEHV